MSLPRLTTRLAKLEARALEARKIATAGEHPPRLMVVYGEDPLPDDLDAPDRVIRVVYAAAQSRVC